VTPSPPQLLVLPTLAAHAPCDVRRISPMLEIISTGSHLSVIQRFRPLGIGPGETQT
jgi:hypothetical protein